MWPLPQIKNEHISIVLHRDRIFCARFVPGGPFLHLDCRAYEISIGNEHIFFNTTALQDAVADFIEICSLQAAYISVVLGEDLAKEHLILHAKSDVSLEELLPCESHTEYCLDYIGPRENQFLLYVCAVSHMLMLQVGIFHYQLPVHLHSVVSPLNAYIQVYKHIAGSAFSQARLAHEIDLERMVIPAVFSTEIIRRSIKIKSGKAYTNQDIILAWGSFLGVQ